MRDDQSGGVVAGFLEAAARPGGRLVFTRIECRQHPERMQVAGIDLEYLLVERDGGGKVAFDQRRMIAVHLEAGQDVDPGVRDTDIVGLGQAVLEALGLAQPEQAARLQEGAWR